MRVTIERSEFLKALSHVQSVVERRNTIPILSNVLVQADGQEIKLTATDLDIEAIETAPAEVSQGGATTAPAHMLYDIVRKLPDGAQREIEQGPDEHRLSVRCGRSQFALQALPSEDFPDLSAGELDHRFAMSAADIKRLIEKTRFAISTEETRYYLNGIYLHEVEVDGAAMLRGVATDGHRLAQVQLPLPEGAAGMPGVILPRKTVSELHRLIEDQDGEIDIALSQSKVRFSVGSLVLTSKLIDGTFPDYERVIPKDNDKTMEVDAKLFAQAVDRVSTISSEKGRAVKLNLEGEKLTLSVNNPDSGSAVAELVATYESEPLDIGFNARYLLDITGQLTSDSASFLFADAGSPTIVRDKDDTTALYVLMPMRV
ncbi:MAG: DNA polymerase III subunit beta [Hyphomicrobiales bacterium]